MIDQAQLHHSQVVNNLKAYESHFHRRQATLGVLLALQQRKSPALLPPLGERSTSEDVKSLSFKIHQAFILLLRA